MTPKICIYSTVLLLPAAITVRARGDSWDVPQYEATRSAVVEWLATAPIEDSVRESWLSEWNNGSPSLQAEQRFELLLATIAAVEPRAQQVVEIINSSFQGIHPPDVDWLHDDSLPNIVRSNLKLAFGVWLSQEGFFDESLKMLSDLLPDDVANPAALLFHRAVAAHRLVNLESSTSAAKTLLANAEDLPVRYEQVARLILADAESVESDSLDHVARRMQDIERRLGKGRATDKVIEIEDGVIESLDKLIERLEQQRQQQQQQQQQQPGGGQRPNQPMQDSQLPGGNVAPGQVDRKDIGDRAGWGNLSDKERDEAMQGVGREFPAHYRDVIEQYFKKLAGGREADSTP